MFTYTRSAPPNQSLYAEDMSQMSSDIPYLSWNILEIELVGSHPLWGHYLFVVQISLAIQFAAYLLPHLKASWNAAKAFAAYLDANPQLYANRNVLELGAGGGLPGIVTALNGAKKVILRISHSFFRLPLGSWHTNFVRACVRSDPS